MRVARLVSGPEPPNSPIAKPPRSNCKSSVRARRPQLEQALIASDPEVRLRRLPLLNECLADELWSASLVYPPEDERPASAVLAWIAGQSGNRPLISDPYGTFLDVPIRIARGPTTFWLAVDDLCRASGNHLRTQYDSRGGGQIVCGGPPGDYPLAHSGPLRGNHRCSPDVHRRVRLCSPGFKVTHTFQLHLHLTWEQRLRLLAYTTQPEVVRVRTDTGQLLAILPPVQRNWNAVCPKPSTSSRRSD